MLSISISFSLWHSVRYNIVANQMTNTMKRHSLKCQYSLRVALPLNLHWSFIHSSVDKIHSVHAGLLRRLSLRSLIADRLSAILLRSSCMFVSSGIRSSWCPQVVHMTASFQFILPQLGQNNPVSFAIHPQ